MMNNHSTGRWASALVLVGALAGACGGGGGSDSGGATNKAGWEKKYASAVKVVSDDLDRSIQALNAGERNVVLMSCTQLNEDLADARKATPVPDATVDAALKSALDATTTGVTTCLQGARLTSNQADTVEKAQREMKTARTSFDAAQTAIGAWK